MLYCNVHVHTAKLLPKNNDNIDDGDHYKNNVRYDDSDSDADGAIKNDDSQNDCSNYVVILICLFK